MVKTYKQKFNQKYGFKLNEHNSHPVHRNPAKLKPETPTCMSLAMTSSGPKAFIP